jgi:hypothetical protein
MISVAVFQTAFYSGFVVFFDCLQRNQDGWRGIRAGIDRRDNFYANGFYIFSGGFYNWDLFLTYYVAKLLFLLADRLELRSIPDPCSGHFDLFFLTMFACKGLSHGIPLWP